MLSKVEAGKKIGEGSGSEKLLNEIQTISKALYLDRNASRKSFSTPSNLSKSTRKPQLIDPKSKLQYGNEDPPSKDKKSIWNWKPLKAFSHVRSRKFNCCFSLQVHSIEGLPSSFDNVSVCVNWKRRDGQLVTRPVKVSEGIAEFEEKLMHTCAVYGSRSGPHHSAKYEAKHFLLYVTVFGAQDLDLGKHRVDLTRLLPLTLEELEEEKSSGKWTTSFKLSGEAKGAMMNVSFGYTVVGDYLPGNNQSAPEALNWKQSTARTVKPVPKFSQGAAKSTIHRTASVPGMLNQRPRVSSRSAENVKDLHHVLPISRLEVAIPMNMLHQKFEEEKLYASAGCEGESNALSQHPELVGTHSSPRSESSQKGVENNFGDGEFSVIEHGIELSSEEQNYPDGDFSVIEQGIEFISDEQKKAEDPSAEATDVSVAGAKISNGDQVAFEEITEVPLQDVGNSNHNEKLGVHQLNFKEDDIYSKMSVMSDLESASLNKSNLETEEFNSLGEKENYMESRADHETDRKGRSLSLDDLDFVANEFLDMLGIEHSPVGLSSGSEPESPREQLLRQFEKDALSSGCSLFDFGMDDDDQRDYGYNPSTASGWGNLSEDFELSSFIQAAEEEHQMGTEAVTTKTRAKMLEDLETETLMREWGLNDKAFQCSPPKNSGGFGSPIDLPPEEPLELPPLGDGLGSFLQTRNGGFLRSMNPSLFRSAKNAGSLIMQISSPVVIPAELGSGMMDILQRLASVGIEKLSMQAHKLMPLEDITGKTMQQVAWEAGSTLEGAERRSVLQHETEIWQDAYVGESTVKRRSSSLKSNKLSSRSVGNEMGAEYVSLEELAPLAMDKIEALSIEGLRIQSGVSDEDSLSNISAQSIGEISAIQGLGVNVSGSLGLEGTAGLQLLDIKDTGEDVDGLMGLSLSLDEWMRLDSGEIGDEDQISEQTSKILAAHHASSLDFIRGGSAGDRRRGKRSGKKCGLLGNNFTVALMVQLHDPLRNYETVGAPMLAFIQVERVFVPPKPRIYRTVSEVSNSYERDDVSKSVVKDDVEEAREEKTFEEEGIPQYRVTEVNIAGLKTEPGKKSPWGTRAQQQSGSRWLLANGMGKSNKNPSSMKPNTVFNKSATPVTTKVQPGNKLWSFSSLVHGMGGKWK